MEAAAGRLSRPVIKTEAGLWVVIAAGVMGLKIIADAVRLGCEVMAVEPLAQRQALGTRKNVSK